MPTPEQPSDVPAHVHPENRYRLTAVDHAARTGFHLLNPDGELRARPVASPRPPRVHTDDRVGLGVVRPPIGMPATGTTQGSGQAKAADHPTVVHLTRSDLGKVRHVPRPGQRTLGRDLARLMGRAFLAGVGAQLGRELARRITR